MTTKFIFTTIVSWVVLSGSMFARTLNIFIVEMAGNSNREKGLPNDVRLLLEKETSSIGQDLFLAFVSDAGANGADPFVSNSLDEYQEAFPSLLANGTLNSSILEDKKKLWQNISKYYGLSSGIDAVNVSLFFSGSYLENQKSLPSYWMINFAAELSVFFELGRDKVTFNLVHPLKFDNSTIERNLWLSKWNFTTRGSAETTFENNLKITFFDEQ